jgi:hypothetical protein
LNEISGIIPISIHTSNSIYIFVSRDLATQNANPPPDPRVSFVPVDVILPLSATEPRLIVIDISSPLNMPPQKRKAPVATEFGAEEAEGRLRRRRSLRVSSSGQKSKYFEAESHSDTAEDETRRKHGRGNCRPAAKKKAEAKKPETESDDDGDDYRDDDDDDDEKEEEEEEEEESEQEKHAEDGSDDEVDEDAPPKVTFIPLPKLRDTGGIAYADDRLHPNTLAFLKDLKANNKRAWLKGRYSIHDSTYYT